MMKIKFGLYLTCILINVSAYAEENMVAKVIILKGHAEAIFKDGKKQEIALDQQIPEGATIKTSDKSFVKLIFIDKSQMNIGPSGEIIISTFPKKEAGIINLVKGQIRSQVTKDYMEMDDKSKSKLYIKTSTAAMGIRGTDFQVNYNPENQNTALITFEGAVAMSHIDKESRHIELDQTHLEKVVSGDKSVMVTTGHISVVNTNIGERAMTPTELAPNQLKVLKENESGLNKETNKNDVKEVRENKTYRPPIPPGVDGGLFANNSNELDKSVTAIAKIEKVAPPPTTLLPPPPTPTGAEMQKAAGFFNQTSGEYKLPAGSIIDLKTINLIPPPANAAYDQNTKTFMVPDNFGRVDKVTGEYKPPQGLTLTNEGKFQVVVPPPPTTQLAPKNVPIDNKNNPPGPALPPPPPAQGTGTVDRVPASIEPAGVATAAGTMMPPPPNPMGTAPMGPPMAPMPQSIMDIRPDMQTFAQVNAPVIINNPNMPPPPPAALDPNLKAIAQDKINTTQTVNQTNTNLGNTATQTKATINIKVQ